MLKPGDRLQDRYRIETILGRGGFGAVYRAVHEGLNREVAIKEALATDDPRLLARFQEEARLLAHLRHTALPLVNDHFREGQRVYLVMDFVPGETLGEYLHRQKPSCLSWEQALALLTPVLDALDYLHQQDPPIIHRDVKPTNIHRTPEGAIYLVDFGIARASHPDDPVSTASHAFSSGYSPYEQYGRGQPPDTRADWYAFGATLYYLLSGIPPCDALDRVAEDPLVPIEQLNSTVPEWSDHIHLTGLSTSGMLSNRQ